MPKPEINIDKSEIVFLDTSGKRARVCNLTYEQIMRIQFSPHVRVGLFGRKESEKIEIFSKNRQQPYVFPATKHQPFFEDYKRKLAEFAKRNFVTFANELPVAEDDAPAAEA